MEWIDKMCEISPTETSEERTTSSSKVQLSNEDIATIAKSVVDMMNNDISNSNPSTATSVPTGEPQDESEV